MTDLTCDEQRVAISRVTRRLVSFAFLCYVVAYIDRVNIGFAAAALQRDLHLSNTPFGVAAGLFFIGYCLFEIPSNLLLERVGARRWIARIMIGWGVVSVGTVFVTNAATFYAARVLLGVAEAGFFPGMVLYLTYWIPASDRARTGALFMMAAPVSFIVGAPVSDALLRLDGRAGLAGCMAGVMSPRVWLLSIVYFLNTLNTYGVFLWLPRILRDATGNGGMRLSLISSIPFCAALAGMVLIGRHSDRTGERKGHVAACALTAAAGLVLATFFPHNLPLLIVSFTLSQIGQRAVMSVFWSIPPMLLAGTAAAAGIALINAIGNLGGAVGPSVMGWLRDATGAYTGGLLVLAGALVLEAILVMMLKLPGKWGIG